MKELYLKDSTFAHCLFSNNPLPPKTFTDKIKWNRNTGPSLETIYTDNHLTECNGGIGWLLESVGVSPANYEYVKLNSNKFKTIWTHEKELLTSLSNARFVPFGGCWIDKVDYNLYTEQKNKLFSIIASGKNQLPGHKLRHTIIKAGGSKIDVFGNGYRPIPDKITGLKNYYFHFVIENCKRDFYFTEKLIDCLMTGTIPIYWGCPSIGNFFNVDGFITFDTLEELKEKLKLCTPEYYASKAQAIKENFKLAQQFLLAEDWIYETIYENKAS